MIPQTMKNSFDFHPIKVSERKLWIGGVFIALFLGMAIMNGVAATTQLVAAYDKLFHAQKTLKAQAAVINGTAASPAK